MDNTIIYAFTPGLLLNLQVMELLNQDLAVIDSWGLK